MKSKSEIGNIRENRLSKTVPAREDLVLNLSISLRFECIIELGD